MYLLEQSSFGPDFALYTRRSLSVRDLSGQYGCIGNYQCSLLIKNNHN